MSLKDAAQQVLELIDLTSLDDNDNPEKIIALCRKATTPYGQVAALCIYPQFIEVAREYCLAHNLNLKIATVANFPNGGADLEKALAQTTAAISLSADEVDLVFPYHALIAGDQTSGATMVKAAKEACGTKLLKVIIESGSLKEPQLIRMASEIAIANGADFIKTSTGKSALSATLVAAEIMLQVIREQGRPCGFKASGGIRSVLEAKAYLDLASQIMGAAWIRPDNFRFGASSLLDDVLHTLEMGQNLLHQTSLKPNNID